MDRGGGQAPGQAQAGVADRRAGSHPLGQRQPRAVSRGSRAGVSVRQGPPRRSHRRAWPTAVQPAFPLRRVRQRVPRPVAVAVQFQQPDWRLPRVQGFRPDHLDRLPARDAGPHPVNRRGRRQAVANRARRRVPARDDDRRETGRHPDQRAIQQAAKKSARLGDQGRAGLRQAGPHLARRMVRRCRLFSLAREQGVQDACPRFALALPHLHDLPGVQGPTLQAGLAALQARPHR